MTTTRLHRRTHSAMLRLLACLLALACLLGIAGCARGPIPTNEYVLTPASLEDPAAHDMLDVSIGVGPVVVPGYLRRRPLVRRVAPGQLDASDTHRWADDLDRDLAHTIAYSLAALVPTPRVGTLPLREPGRPDYRVGVVVERFEPAPDGCVELAARWEVVRNRDDATIATRWARLRDPQCGDEPAEAVAAMSRLVRAMCGEIAEVVRGDAAVRGDGLGQEDMPRPDPCG